MAKRVAVVLSGCGHLDGSEITEAVCALIALDLSGAEVQCYAPDKDQLHVIDHLRGAVVQGERRGVMREAARLARGNVKPLSDLRVSDFDALVFPGGFGAAKNLCDYAVSGVDCQVDGTVEAIIKETHGVGKPICAICIAPILIAKCLGKKVHPVLTLGPGGDASKHAEQMGARHQAATATQIVADEANKIVTTSAYMDATRIGQVWEGVQKAIEKVLQMA